MKANTNQVYANKLPNAPAGTITTHAKLAIQSNESISASWRANALS